MADPVIMDYDDAWPGIYSMLRARVAAELGTLAIAIEHVGSTAVPGLAANPIIDIDVVIASRDDLPRVIAALRRVGYIHLGDAGEAGREAFAAPPGLPRHNLYVCSADSPVLSRHLLFRDYLREHEERARDYADLKRDLAERYSADPVAYADAKSEFVAETLRDAEGQDDSAP